MTPNQRPPHTPNDFQRIAFFMNGILSDETLDNLPCPEHLQCDFNDLDSKGKGELYVNAFHTLFRDAAIEVAGLLQRKLEPMELNLIRRRIINNFKKFGIEYDREL